MIFHGTIYDILTGKIQSLLQVGIEADLDIQILSSGFALSKVKSQINQYIDILTELPIDKAAIIAVWDKTSITADGIDTAILSGLPLNSTVFIDEIPFDVVDGVLEFKASSLGNYQFRIDEVQYLEKEWVINAN